jgi:excisionase family DNA binding protein
MQDYLTTDEVAEMLRTSIETVRFWRHIHKGPPSFKVGRRVLYARDDVQSFIRAARDENASMLLNDGQLGGAS